VETVEFISKERAAQVFREEFGSDVFDILEDNPLPSSFRIKLAKEFRALDEIEQVVKQLQELSGVDDVVYRGNVIQALDKYTRYANIINIVFLVFVFLGSLFMVSNTTRLIINAKKNIIDAMRLVGATRLFLRMPFLIEGVIQGLLGGIIAMLLLYAFVNIFDLKISGLLIVDNYILILLIVTGLLFGFFGSLFATYRFLDK
jgi:cell division transport system permease protein